ncbi:beta,beta-carotene 15,15'-dioxygenase-like [Branchiostoma floridae x Branchiostoma japonicum]
MLKTPVLLCLLCVALRQGALSVSPGEDGVGFAFQPNLHEFHKTPMKFESNSPIPKWLSGTLVRNAPARYEVGDRSVVDIFDGFAKLHSIDITPQSLNFSASFIKSGIYNRSIEANTIAPMVTFLGVDPPFSLYERLEALAKTLDNNDVNVWKFGTGDATTYAALTDGWVFPEFNIDTLDTLGVVQPDPLGDGQNGFGVGPPTVYLSCAHPVVEPSTGHSITYVIKPSYLPGQSSVLSVIRIKDLGHIETIGSFEIQKNSYMHSFALTENYAIFFLQPLYFDFIKLMTTVEMQYAMEWVSGDKMAIHAVNLKNGSVSTLSADPRFYTHHVNAYETGEGHVVADVITFPDPTPFLTALSLDKLRDLTHLRKMDSYARLTRYYLNLTAETVKVEPFVSKTALGDFMNKLDLPIINEKYRTKRYCIFYGTVTSFATSSPFNGSIPIVKKNVCVPGSDAHWSRPNHFAGEPNFVADPSGTHEDDGVILSSVLDADRGLNYLLILDARTFEEINTAYMPTWIPFGFHGQFFPRSFQ